MSKTQRRQNLEDFANTFLTVYEDKMKEIDTRELIPFKNTTIEWDEGLGCKWYLRKCILSNDPKRPCTEYFLRRTYAKLTKSINERTVYDECWIYLPMEYPCETKNDSHNAVINEYYFQGYSGYSPKLIR
jgi:hypothetical protein